MNHRTRIAGPLVARFYVTDAASPPPTTDPVSLALAGVRDELTGIASTLARLVASLEA